VKNLVEDCYISGDSLLDMAVGSTPDYSYLFTFKGESTEPPVTLTLTPDAAIWLRDRLSECLSGHTIRARTGNRKRKRR
jgi:hypothetical protein